jgi:hypothetical protein
VTADAVGSPSGSDAVDVSLSVTRHNTHRNPSVTLDHGTLYKPARISAVTLPLLLSGERYLSIYLILSAALGPGFYSATNRNEYKKLK